MHEEPLTGEDPLDVDQDAPHAAVQGDRPVGVVGPHGNVGGEPPTEEGLELGEFRRVGGDLEGCHGLLVPQLRGICTGGPAVSGASRRPPGAARRCGG
ncbi:hypothetical protein EB118_18225 [bacterium]|nr:hypothetical protein [bacterium]